MEFGNHLSAVAPIAGSKRLRRQGSRPRGNPARLKVAFGMEMNQFFPPPKSLGKFLKTYKDDIWWSRETLKARKREDALLCQTRSSARSYERACKEIYHLLATSIENQKGIDLTSLRLETLLIDEIRPGLDHGHRGIEVGGMTLRLDKTKQVRQKILDDQDIMNTEILAVLSKKESELARTWALVIALCDSFVT